MAEQYAAPPTPIDFVAAKDSVRDKALVEGLEELYTSNKPAAETYEWSAEDRADKEKQIEDAKGRLAFTQEMIEDTEKELAFMQGNKTNRDISGADIMEMYPDIAEEVEKEIEEREWFKDTLGK
uniref:ATP synthase subunit d, mitochondrial n=2 Tax=Odontella aurita TaxID=265563 RepID=A0A7S4I1P7_9STRA|mmetsp:Transcript_18502/g.53357  ORF Transcript_18502/g.53357 Transcript_18502/m.53357 type:complete len:124 (+) Transcript_18502:294-665(+)